MSEISIWQCDRCGTKEFNHDSWLHIYVQPYGQTAAKSFCADLCVPCSFRIRTVVDEVEARANHNETP